MVQCENVSKNRFTAEEQSTKYFFQPASDHCMLLWCITLAYLCWKKQSEFCRCSFWVRYLHNPKRFQQSSNREKYIILLEVTTCFIWSPVTMTSRRDLENQEGFPNTKLNITWIKLELARLVSLNVSARATSDRFSSAGNSNYIFCFHCFDWETSCIWHWLCYFSTITGSERQRLTRDCATAVM